MTPENRKALEAMADDYERDAQWMAREALSITDYERHKAHAEGAKNHHEDAAAIRAALTTIDALRAENEALRAVARAAHELVEWDWLHLLDDGLSSRDVIADAKKLQTALDAAGKVTP